MSKLRNATKLEQLQAVSSLDFFPWTVLIVDHPFRFVVNVERNRYFLPNTSTCSTRQMLTIDDFKNPNTKKHTWRANIIYAMSEELVSFSRN